MSHAATDVSTLEGRLSAFALATGSALSEALRRCSELENVSEEDRFEEEDHMLALASEIDRLRCAVRPHNLARVLVECGIVQPDAVSDGEGYDRGHTLAAIDTAAKRLAQPNNKITNSWA